MFCLCNIGQDNVFHDILERKIALIDVKRLFLGSFYTKTVKEKVLTKALGYPLKKWYFWTFLKV